MTWILRKMRKTTCQTWNEILRQYCDHSKELLKSKLRCNSDYYCCFYMECAFYCKIHFLATLQLILLFHTFHTIVNKSEIFQINSKRVMEEHHHASPHVVGEGDAVVAPIKPRLQTLLVIAWLTVIQGGHKVDKNPGTWYQICMPAQRHWGDSLITHCNKSKDTKKLMQSL